MRKFCNHAAVERNVIALEAFRVVGELRNVRASKSTKVVDRKRKYRLGVERKVTHTLSQTL